MLVCCNYMKVTPTAFLLYTSAALYLCKVETDITEVSIYITDTNGFDYDYDYTFISDIFLLRFK